MMTRAQILYEMELIEKRQAFLERERSRYEAMLMDFIDQTQVQLRLHPSFNGLTLNPIDVERR